VRIALADPATASPANGLSRLRIERLERAQQTDVAGQTDVPAR
jgi:hypothetical protein